MISHKTNQIVLAAKPLAGDLGRRFCLAALFAATFAHQSTGANGQQPVDISQAAKTSPASYVQGELLVKVQSGPYSQKASLSHAIAGATVLRTFPAIGWQHIRLPEGMSVREGIEAYRTLPGGVEA